MHDILNRVGYSTPVRRRVTGSPALMRLAGRFVAGEDVDDAVTAVAALASRGLRSTVNRRGPAVTTVGDAARELAEAVRLADEVVRARLAPDSEISVKLQQLGLATGGGAMLARDNLLTLCREAAARGLRVTVDMEADDEVEETLAAVASVRAHVPDIGIAVQAYLPRTVGDCRRLAQDRARVRLCKGGYRARDGLRGRSLLAAYQRCLETLLDGGAYAMVATHDPRLIATAQRTVRERSLPAEAYEHQMLMGVAQDQQQRLTSEGATVRVYVPYGPEWYAWFVHRLVERPANLRLLVGSAGVSPDRPRPPAG